MQKVLDLLSGSSTCLESADYRRLQGARRPFQPVLSGD
jgi:hypothetical protein